MLKIAVQSGPIYDEKDIDGSFKALKECGFDAVDFNIDTYISVKEVTAMEGNYTSFFDQSVEELCEYFRPTKEAAEKYGISFCQMHAPFPVWRKEREDLTAYLLGAVEKCMAVCQYVGCPAIVVHPVTRSTKEKEIATNLDIYRRLMPAAKKYGVKICLENLFSQYKGRIIEGACSNVDDAVWYLDTLNKEAGAELFGFCLDVGHANLLGRDLYKYITALGSRLTNLHIHDNDGRSDLHMMPYTYTKNWGADWICNWDAFVDGLAAVGYKGALSFETFRVLGSFPRELWPEALKLISATGRLWAKRIEEKA